MRVTYMLTIKVEGTDRRANWYVNQGIEALREIKWQFDRNHYGSQPEYVVCADGHELDFVLERFKNIPFVASSICKWSGEWAKFIVENL